MKSKVTDNESFSNLFLSFKRDQWAEEIEAYLQDHTASDDPARLQEWLEETMDEPVHSSI